jgi:hypothetical protein
VEELPDEVPLPAPVEPLLIFCMTAFDFIVSSFFFFGIDLLLIAACGGGTGSIDGDGGSTEPGS